MSHCRFKYVLDKTKIFEALWNLTKMAAENNQVGNHILVWCRLTPINSLG